MVATNQNQWALKWPYTRPGGALPVVNDTVPDPLARLTALNGQRQATAQDTGWSSTPNTLGGSVDYGAGQQGAATAYTGNPWQNYNDPASNSGWNFTQDPLFNAGADKPTWDLAQTGAKSETDRARVWRWTLDDLKRQNLDPGSAPQATVQAAYLGNIARLKRDYAANGMNWQGSAYAGYDPYLGGQAGATQQGGARGGDGQGTGAQIDPNTRLPGFGLPNGGMMYDQGLGGPTDMNRNGGNVPPPAPQTGGSSMDSGGGGNPTPTTTVPPVTSTTNQNPTPGQPGYAGFFNLNNPQQAVRDYINGHFGQGAADTNMFFGDWIKKLMGNLIPTIMQLTVGQNGKPALDRLGNLGSVLDPILFGGQGTLGGNLQGFANQAQSSLMGSMPGMDASTQADLLRNLTALRTVGENPYMASATNNRLDAAIGSAQDQASGVIRNGGKMPNNYSLWDYINNQLPQGYVNPFQGQR